MFTKATSLILLLCLMQLCRPLLGQSVLRPEIQQVVDAMAEGNRYEGPYIGPGGTESVQYDLFRSLRTQGTTEELRQICGHANAVVRCYAFKALLSAQDTSAFNILIDRLRDQAPLLQINGCVGRGTTVSDLMLQTAWEHWTERPSLAPSDSQLAYLDSLLIFDSRTAPQFKRRRLQSLEPQASYHLMLRDYVMAGEFLEAAVALARFKDPTDLPLLLRLFENKDALYEACYAAREFPHPDFLARLEVVFEGEWRDRYYDFQLWRILMQALAQYDSPKTMALFQRALNARDRYRRQTLGKYVLIAITKYPNPRFEPLKERIRLSDFEKEYFEAEMSVEK